jgi:hypothetical protein
MSTDAELSNRATSPGAEPKMRGESPSTGARSGRVRTRRHWGYIAAGVGLMLLTAVVFATVWASGRATSPVLALANTVHRGEQLTAEDLTVAHTVSDPALSVLKASQVSDVVGQRAALDMPAGSLLNPEALVSESLPRAGHALVGLHLAPAQLPLTPLRPGDSVTIVHAGHNGDVVAADALTVPGVVVGTGTAEDGARKVDVTVPTADAAAVAGWVATGSAAVYLDSQER